MKLTTKITCLESSMYFTSSQTFCLHIYYTVYTSVAKQYNVRFFFFTLISLAANFLTAHFHTISAQINGVTSGKTFLYLKLPQKKTLKEFFGYPKAWSAPPLTIWNGPVNTIPVVRFCLNYKTELDQAGYINLK